MDGTAITQPPGLYVAIGAAVVVLGLVVWGVVASRRRARERGRLRSHFGAEYDRTLALHGSERAAVADLREREQLREGLELRDLGPADLDLIRRHMAAAQYRFVEDPADALRQAQRVVTVVLRAKGYPIAEQRDTAVRAFSYDHPGHAGSVVQLLEGRHDGDAAHMRTVFLNARRALQDVTGVSWVLADTTAPPSDLRVEHDADRSAATSGSAPMR